MKLICAFVLAYADCWFSHAVAQMLALAVLMTAGWSFDFRIREFFLRTQVAIIRLSSLSNCAADLCLCLHFYHDFDLCREYE